MAHFATRTVVWGSTDRPRAGAGNGLATGGIDGRLPQRRAMAGKTVDISSYRGKRVTILGMARQGIALARFFVSAGARVTVSDIRRAEQLAAAQADLQAYADSIAGTAEGSLEFVLGGHPAELLDRTDILCLSGGVSPALPIVEAAVMRGIPLTNDSLLTLQHSPVPVIGISGSAGKTTTSTLVGLMLEASRFTVHVGGNIGTPLLDKLDQIHAGDKVVMELSSFQLELFDRSPAVAALLNVTPNHLDRHLSMSHYAAAKANVLRYQEPGDSCVLSADDSYTGPWLRSGRCEIPAGGDQPEVRFPLRAARLGFSLIEELAAGAFLRGDRLIWRQPWASDMQICRSRQINLRGRHNLANILAACCIAGAAGADPDAMSQVATTFRGVEHRLEVIRRRNGVLWINDSIATTPERAMAALQAFTEPVVLLAGGRDKHLPWEGLVGLAHRRAHHVVLFGEAAPLIGEALAAYERETGVAPLPVARCADLPDAIAAADAVARPGDVVLLSPGGTSFDAYVDFTARGQHFRELVEALP